MVRFTCIHCGNRIAVNDRYMDRLAQCPECGGLTHPLAHQLVEARKQTEAASAKADPQPPPCGNCGGPIGKLQTPLEWDGHQICSACHRELSLAKAAAEAPPAAPMSAQPMLPAPAVVQPSAQPVVIESPGQFSRKANDLSIIVRTVALGLCAAAAGLYLVVTILSQLGSLLFWGAIIALAAGAVYWGRKVWLQVRRRMGMGTNPARRVNAVVRD